MVREVQGGDSRSILKKTCMNAIGSKVDGMSLMHSNVLVGSCSGFSDPFARVIL
jgi:hypothetical protein